MSKSKIERLADEAMVCHEKGEYARELKLWRQISKKQPEDPHWKHNIAFALMNCGRHFEALELFDALAQSHPKLSRVHNNRAVLLMRLGVDLPHLYPAFAQALVASETYPDFLRHFLNLCVTAAYGFDEGAERVVEGITDISFQVLKQNTEPNTFEKEAPYLSDVALAYKHIAGFREALSKRNWRTAESKLMEAEAQFKALGLDNLAVGLETVKGISELFRDVVTTIEKISTTPSFASTLVLERFENLLMRTRALGKEQSESALRSLINSIGWFLTGAIAQLRFFSNPIGGFVEDKIPQSAITQITSISFTDAGRNFSSLLQFINQQCSELVRVSESVADGDAINELRDEMWIHIALFCKGLIFNFKAIDITIARGVLGWSQSPLEEAMRDVMGFKSFIERQAYKDIFVNGNPQENIARSLLQAYLTPRSYREVPVRGGRTDLLVCTKNGRFLYETKIWRGDKNHQQGLRELEEYIIGEDDDDELIGIFYLVFDPTKSGQAQSQLKGSFTSKTIRGNDVNVVAINLTLPQPSKKK